MIVEMGGYKYAVNFGYERVDRIWDDETQLPKDIINQGAKFLVDPPADVIRAKYITYCTIEKIITTGKDGVRESLAGGMVAKHINDPLNKDEGRKKALAKALIAIPRAEFKEFRTKVWNQYFKTHKSGKLINIKASKKKSQEEIAA